MTVTISRLYDNYADAQRAVQGLESAGVPHSDISIVANNSDNWYNGGKRVDRDSDGSMIALKVPGRVPGSEQASVVRRVSWQALAC
jgi:hypothetical protein